MIGKLIPFRNTSGSAEDMSDEALVAACASGEPAALAALFDRYHLDVHRFLVRLSGVDDHVVDDLMQETFLEVYRGARRYRRRATVRTWIFGIAANLARRHVRSDTRRKARAAAFIERHPSLPTSPQYTAQQRELVDRLAVALERLPHDLRVAFLLCDVEEIRGVDAARALGVRKGTLYRRLHEARMALRAAVEGEEQ